MPVSGGDASGLEFPHDGFDRGTDDEAEIQRPRARILCSGKEFCGARVNIDFRGSKEERIPAVFPAQLHPENVRVKAQTLFQARGCQDEMIEAGDFHASSSFLSADEMFFLVYLMAIRCVR